MKRKCKRSSGITKLKIKNSTRVFFIIIALVLFAISSKKTYTNLFQTKEQTKEQKIYQYSNIYNLDYIVNIKPNDFITEKSLEKDQTYVADLIKTLDMDIEYQYNSSKDTNVKCDYKIDAIIGGSYTKDGNIYDIWNKTYNLKEVTDKEFNKDIKIKENINVDYQKYHQEVKDFKQTMGMSMDAYLYIKLTVNTSTNVNGQDVKNQYISNYSITIGDKIAKVDGKTSDTTEDYIIEKTSVKKETDILSIIINIIILILSVYIMYYIKYRTKMAYSIRNDFKLELNKILKSCQDRIVVVKNKVELEQENTIDVRDFGELIKLSEELFKPILYWISEENDEAWFSIISNKIEYRFILKK